MITRPTTTNAANTAKNRTASVACSAEAPPSPARRASAERALSRTTSPNVVVTTGCNQWDEGLDVVVEGEAVRVTDPATLERLARAWAGKWDGRWTYTAVQDGFDSIQAHQHAEVGRFWKRADVEVEGAGRRLQQVIRWNLFQLLQVDVQLPDHLVLFVDQAVVFFLLVAPGLVALGGDVFQLLLKLRDNAAQLVVLADVKEEEVDRRLRRVELLRRPLEGDLRTGQLRERLLQPRVVQNRL